MSLVALGRRLVPPKAREAPGVRQALGNAREAFAVRTIFASGTFDRPWYELQRGRSFRTDLLAVVDYVRHGRALGLSPTPLFEPEWFDRRRWNTRPFDPFALYLRRRAGKGRPHPLFDPMEHLRQYPKARTFRGGPLAHFMSFATDDTPLPLPVGLAHQQVTYGQLRARAVEALGVWQQQELLRRAPRRVQQMPQGEQQALLDEVAGVQLPAASIDEPLVSIVMPTWNRAAALRRAVRSVQAQTYGGWELIVVDDGSTDDTAFVLQGLTAFDARIRVVRGEHAGVSRARNLAIAQARGRYVAFLDSDNTWQPDFLRITLSAMQRRDLDGAYTAMELRDGKRTTFRAFDGGREHLLVGNHIDLNVLVVRADRLAQTGGFAEDLRRTVDYDLVLRLSQSCQLTYLPYIGAIYSEDREDPTRISVREPLTWDYVVRSRHLVDWASARDRERVPGRISAVVPVHNHPGEAVRGIEALLQWDGDLELVVVDAGSRRSASSMLATLSLADPRVRWHRMPVNLGFALGTNVGLGLTTGELLLVCDPHVLLRSGLGALRDALDEGTVVVAPLVLGAQGTVASAGVTAVEGVDQPVGVLRGHPREDVAQGGELDVVAVDERVFLVRAGEVAALGGLQPLLLHDGHGIDLTLRLRERRGGGGAKVLTSVQAWVIDRPERATDGHDVALVRERWRAAAPAPDTSAWARCGLRLAHVRAVSVGPGVLVPRPVTVYDRPSARERALAGAPLRWALQIAAPSGPDGEKWGDWHFAQSLAAALRRQGHEVVVDLREAAERASNYLDDVRVVLRGLDRVAPVPGQVNLLWVISHPDLVEPSELAGYDRVFAAGGRWAAQASARWGVPIEPLLQCTDSTIFRPDAAEPGTGERVLFVGNSRNIYRTSVRAAVEADADLAVYGSMWDAFIDPRLVRAPAVANDRLPAMYRAAGVVLNDHWDDMRREGFWSNRLFDVAAAGGRVLSDHIEGTEAIFGPSVRTWRSPEHLTQLLRQPVDELFPDDATIVANAARIGAEHSFDARARRLIQVAVERLT